MTAAPHRVLAMSRQPLRSRRGVAASEFALVAPIFVTVILAAVDIGNAVQQNIRLEAAARASLPYAHVYPSDTGGIRNIVVNALSGWNNVTVGNVTLTCDCATTTNNVTTTTSNDCVSACSVNTAELRQFISINVSRNYSGFLFLQNRTLHGNIQMRVQ